MNKNENSSDVIVKLVVFLGAIAAIGVAAMLIVKRFRKQSLCDDGICFDDEDFCDDCDCCCDCEDCEPETEAPAEE